NWFGLETTLQPVANCDFRDAGDIYGSARHFGRQRIAASHRWKSLGDYRRVNLGSNQLPDFKRDHSSRDKLAGQLRRTQTIPHHLYRHLYVIVRALWCSDESGTVALRARFAGRWWRGFAADRAGSVVGEFPC